MFSHLSPHPADAPMITKSLLIARGLFGVADRVRSQLGAERFDAEFRPRLRKIMDNLALGPNPALLEPLADALEWGFHTPAQPILDALIATQGFDWRFVTGRRKRFKALEPGQPLTTALLALWSDALDSATAFMA